MAKTPLRIVKKYPEYYNVELTEESLKPVELSGDIVDNSSDSDLMNVIFAPDPLTGFPRSDLAIVMSKDSNPVISEYIHDTLMKVKETGAAAPDADAAIVGVKSRNETFEEYANRLKELVGSYVKDEK